MSTDAALLLLLSLATALLLSSAQSPCMDTVVCSCGGTAKTFTMCAEEQNATADPCSQWLECKSCQEGSCSTGVDRTPKSRRKRQYRRHGRPSYPTRPVQPHGHYDGDDCSDDIDSPKLGSLRCSTGRGRKTCTGTCLPGYTFENRHEEAEMVLNCRDGRWTPARAFPPCVSGGYCDLVVEGHGRFNCTTGMHGTRCDVFCGTRYSGRYSCYPGRPWEPSLPHCVRSKDGQPGTGEGRQPCRCEYGASCDSSGRCVCPVGRTGTLCESVVPEKTCPDPGQVTSADRLNTDGSPSLGVQSYRPGQSVAYTCREGYALQRRSLITCQNSGFWSNSLPYCTPIPTPELMLQTTTTASPDRGGGIVFCRDPGGVANGNRVPSVSPNRNGFPQGSDLVYSCNPGYTLQGGGNLFCLTSGRWSSAVPRCQQVPERAGVSPTRGGGIVFCRDPGGVANGNRVPSAAPNRSGFPQGSGLVYSCNQGYTLQGSGSLFCLTSGRWSSAVPQCEPSVPERAGGDGEYCLNPGSIQNGKIIYYPDINSRTGSEDDSLDDPEYPPGVRLEYSCNGGYRLQGSFEMTCLGDTGLWSTYPPTCIPDTPTDIFYCDNPGPLANGQRTHFSSLDSRPSQGSTEDPQYPEGSRFEYSCNAGYTMEGRRSQTCEKGYWSAPKPSCERGAPATMMYCDNPGAILNGGVQQFPPAMTPKSGTSISQSDLEYPEGTRLQYSCDDGFTIIGTSSLLCLPTSHWSSYPPICSAECGQSSITSGVRIFNGTETLYGEWPWVVSIRESRESRITCGGAVVNSRTVVTAAHCLTGSDSYLLYFGKIHQLDRDDDDQVKERTSSRIILHPDYTDTSMDHDIGLVHLSEPIQFTDRIVPICLPDTWTTATNLRTGSKGFVTGFGENELGLQPDELMQASIPVQDNEVCVKYYRDQGINLVMSQNMFCAGYAGGDQATCEGDSGSALVFYDAGLERFTLEGLVSFGTNRQCGVQGRYTVFTKVFPFVHWILTNQA